MELAIVAGETNVSVKSLELPNTRSVERIRHGDAEIFLAGVEILRPDSPAPGTLGGRDNHAVVEMDTIRRADLDGTANELSIRSDQADRCHCVQPFQNSMRIRRRRNLVQQSGGEFSQHFGCE